MAAVACTAGIVTISAYGDGAESKSVVDAEIRTYENGQPRQALRSLETYLATNPDDPNALYVDGFINAEIGNPNPAIERLSHMVQLRPNAFYAWELLTQQYQDQGDKDHRDNAIANIRRIYRSTSGRDILSKIYFIREKMTIGGTDYSVLDPLNTGNVASYRYLFIPTKEMSRPQHVILLRFDESLNQVWRDEAQLAPLSRLLTLDRLDLGPDGVARRETFHLYMNEPTYDDVRALVVDILTGKATPLSVGEGETPNLLGIGVPRN